MVKRLTAKRIFGKACLTSNGGVPRNAGNV